MKFILFSERRWRETSILIALLAKQTINIEKNCNSAGTKQKTFKFNENNNKIKMWRKNEEKMTTKQLKLWRKKTKEKKRLKQQPTSTSDTDFVAAVDDVVVVIVVV